MVRLFILLVAFIPSIAFAQKKYCLLVGTYTKGKSTGIYVYDFNTKDGSSKLVDSAAVSNPSYLAIAPNQKWVYSVSETMRGNFSGKVKAFSFDRSTKHLSALNEASSFGDNPCYITVDKTGNWIIVGNYTSGTLAVLPIEKNGTIGSAVSTITHQGHSINPKRQTSPHVHAAVLSPDNKYLFVPDLGIDKLMAYSFDSKTGKLKAAKDSAIKLEDGSGPRHFEFHPNGKWAYLVQEMSGNVTAFNYRDGNLSTIQSINCIPSNYDKYFTSADIHVSNDGKFVYASTRDSLNIITIFKTDEKTGKLSWLGQQSTLGKTPRNFNFDPSGNYLLVANQNSDSIVVFNINRKTGLLTDTGKRIDVGSPVCLKWIER